MSRKRKRQAGAYSRRQRQRTITAARNDPMQIVVNPRTGGFLGRELKNFDCFGQWDVQSSFDGTGGVVSDVRHQTVAVSGATLCSMINGTGQQARDGRRAVIKSIYISGVLDYTTTVVSTIDDVVGVFVALVLDTQCNGSNPASEQVYINPSNGSPAATSELFMTPKPFRNLEYTGRYKVLKSKFLSARDQTTLLDPSTSSVSVVPSVSRTFEMFWKGDIPLEFNSSAFDVGTLTNNNIFLIAYKGSPLYDVTLVWKSRIRHLA